MKTVKSTEELKRLALARGAGASFSGGKFNIGASKVSPIRQTQETPEAKPAPEPVQVQQDIGPAVKGAVDAMAQVASQMADDNARVMAEVAKAIERLTAMPAQPAPEPPIAREIEAKANHWRMTVNRNPRGFMDSVDIVRIG